MEHWRQDGGNKAYHENLHYRKHLGVCILTMAKLSKKNRKQGRAHSQIYKAIYISILNFLHKLIRITPPISNFFTSDLVKNLRHHEVGIVLTTTGAKIETSRLAVEPAILGMRKHGFKLTKNMIFF
jgi:hypothetical protein